MARANVAVAALLAAALLSASALVLPAQLARRDVAVPRLHVDGTALHPGAFVYQITLERDVSSTVLGTRTVTVAPATYAGAPAWLLVETRTGDRINAVDSLYTDYASLRAVHWSSAQGDARLVAEFRADTAYGGTSAVLGGRRSIVAAVPAGTLINAAMLETVLRLAPLQPVWEDSASTLSVALSGATVLPTRLSVIGEDQVHLPAGTFDCWVVSVHAGDQARGMYWVTKQDPIVVRSTLDVPILGGAQMVSALVRITR